MAITASVQRPDAEWRIISSAWALAGIVVVAAALRLLFLGQRSYWLDEVISVELARLSGSELLHAWTSTEPNMPFYTLLLRAWIRAFGEGELAVRLLSCLPSIAVVPALYALVLRLFDRNTALLSSALLALHAFQIHYGQEARSYSLVCFLALLSSWALVEAVRQPGAGRWCVYVLVSVSAIYSHACAAFILLGHAASIYLCPFGRGSRRGFLVSVAVTVLLALPLLWLVAARVAGLDTTGLALSGIRGLWRSFLGIGGTSPLFALLSIVAVVIAMLPLRRLPAPMLVASSHSEYGIPESWARWFTFFWLIAPIVVLSLVSVRKSFLIDRYLIVAAPAVVILVARAVLRAPSRRHLQWAVAILLVLSTERVIHHFRRASGADWRRATALLIEKTGESDAIVLSPYYTRINIDHYQRRQGARRELPIVWPTQWRALYDPPEADPSRQDLAALAARHERLWLVLSHTKETVATRFGASIDGIYSLVEMTSLTGIAIAQYQHNADAPD